MSAAAVNFPFARYADELRGAAVTFCEGGCTQSEFVEAVLQIEEEKLRPHGLTLVVSHTIDEWITVLVKQDGSGQLCAAFEFMPDLRQFRRFSRLEDYGAASVPRR
jgi:hypothetical protein